VPRDGVPVLGAVDGDAGSRRSLWPPRLREQDEARVAEPRQDLVVDEVLRAEASGDARGRQARDELLQLERERARLAGRAHVGVVDAHARGDLLDLERRE
jgi:hypothetical protein